MEIKKRRIWLAALLNILLPGLGYIYCGLVKRSLMIYVALLIIFMPFAYLVWFAINRPFNILLFLFAVILIYSFLVIDVILIANKSKAEYRLKFYNKWYYYLGYILICAFVLHPLFKLPVKIFIARAYKHPSGSMEPTLRPGDYIITNNFIYRFQEPKKGDIIVFKFPKDERKEFVKRIVAFGGDIVEIRSKILYINNIAVDEPYKIINDPNVIPSEQSRRDNMEPIEVPRNSYFVLGDNRDYSLDSRFFGIINRSSIKGKVSSIYFSWDNNSSKCRWKRIGNNL